MLSAIAAGLVALFPKAGWMPNGPFAILSASAARPLASATYPVSAYAIGFAAFAAVAIALVSIAHLVPAGLIRDLLAAPTGGSGTATWFWRDAWLPIAAINWAFVALILSGVPTALLTAVLRLRAARG